MAAFDALDRDRVRHLGVGELGDRIVGRVLNRKCLRGAGFETKQLCIEAWWVRCRTELDVDVVKGIGLPGRVLALQIHGDGIALNDAAAFDGFGPRRAFTQHLECLFGGRLHSARPTAGSG